MAPRISRKDAESAEKAEIEQINLALAEVKSDNFKLSEQLNNVQLMVDERGWNSIFDQTLGKGMSLSQLQSASNQIRELLAANPFIARGSEVRNVYIWAGGLDISAQSNKGVPSDLTAKIANLTDTPSWTRYIMDSDARETLERTAGTDGNLFVLGDNLTKKVQRVSIHEIKAAYYNPDNTEEIWAYRREWTPDPGKPAETMIRWYYTDIFEGTKQSTLANSTGGQARVDKTKTMIDVAFNRQVGWAFGVPDFLAVLAWARLYKEFLVNGYVMSRALAQFAYKVTVQSQAGANAAAVSIAKPGQSGSTHIGANDLTPMTTAGKGYDFATGSPLLAAIAAGMGITLAELDGTQQAEFTATGRGMAALRRKTWDSFFKRLFKWAGESKKIRTVWHDLSDAQVQRALQAITLANNTGLFASEVVQNMIADVMQIENPGAVPDGVLLPNNKASLARADIDTDGTTPAGGTKNDPGITGTSGSTSGSGQGQSGPAGSLGNDHSTDGK